jgi:spore maturation protein CgeB
MLSPILRNTGGNLMKIVMFYHSLVSDWNHGNAHFLRGVAASLQSLGHDVEVHEPADGWSRTNLLENHGDMMIRLFQETYPELEPNIYDPEDPDLEDLVSDADLVIAHEWNPPDLIARLGELRRGRRFVLLFHDTHHRMVTDPDSMCRYDLSGYDGVLAFGAVLRDLYQKRGLARRVWVWHEAADVERFHPMPDFRHDGDLVWIGNWGDGERSAELHEFLIDPVRKLGLRAAVYGVRYPPDALQALAAAGIEYKGWLPNFQVPWIFARYRATVHVPRRPYVESLPGIPTIRPFEALACGIPLVCSPWDDTEGLFAAGEDYLVAKDGTEMTAQLQRLMNDSSLRGHLSTTGRRTILRKHSCMHRVAELLEIHRGIVAEFPPMRKTLSSYSS